MAQARLIGRAFVLFATGIDGWGLFDGGEIASFEQEFAHEVGEPQDGMGDLVGSGGEPVEGVGDHGGVDLQLDRILVVAEELAEFEGAV